MKNDILEGADPYRQSSFSLANRAARIAWNLVYILLFRFTPRLMYSWRAFLLRIFGAKIGKGCHVYPKSIVWAPWNLEMGDCSCIADEVLCYSMARIIIGERSVISQGVRLYTGSHDYESPNFQLYAKPITIGPNVWIAAEAFVMPGVTISEGSVIGARSVVTHDMPAWTVCAGNPCKSIKQRQIKR